jgi:hypothetical protein
VCGNVRTGHIGRKRRASSQPATSSRDVNDQELMMHTQDKLCVKPLRVPAHCRLSEGVLRLHHLLRGDEVSPHVRREVDRL